MLTENLCASSEFWKLFPGHLVWHIGMPLGLMNCLSVCALLQAESHGKYPYFTGKEEKRWLLWARAMCCPLIRTEFQPRPQPELPFWPRRVQRGIRRGQELVPFGDPCLPKSLLARHMLTSREASAVPVGLPRSVSASGDLESLRSPAAAAAKRTSADKKSRFTPQSTVAISVEPQSRETEADASSSLAA